MITFEVPAAGTVVEPDTGNVVANTETNQVGAYLKGENVAEATYPGVNVISTLYEGYVTSGTLHAGVRVGSTGTLVFAGQAPVECEVLEVRLPYGESGLLGTVLTKAIGTKIKLVSRSTG